MKRKSIVLFLLVITMAVSVMACGKSKEEKELEEFANELGVEVDDLSEFEKAILEEEIAYQNEKEAQAEIQSEYKLYDKSPEWDNVEYPQLAVQIDDTVYEFGVTVGEVIDKIESSKIEYGYDDRFTYNPEKIVNAKMQDTIWVTRDGADWFNIYYVNQTDEVASIDDCICKYIEIRNAALPFSWICGVSSEEWLGMSYQDIDSLNAEGNLLSGFDVKRNDLYNATNWTFTKDLVVERNGNTYAINSNVFAEIDMNTGSVSKISSWALEPKEYYDLVALETFDGLSEVAWDKLNQEIDKVLEFNKNKYTSMKLVEASLYREYSMLDNDYSKDIQLKLYCEAVTVDGETIYMTGGCSNPLLANGTYITYPEFVSVGFMGVYTSLDEIKAYERDDSLEIGRITF